MPETATRLPRIRSDKKPAWADVLDRFYADSFDARTKDALLESAEAYADMDPEEQSFHEAHLAYLQVRALADIHATLKGIERAVAGLDPKALVALKHLPGIRKALVQIAHGQEEMLDALESGAPSGVAGDEDAEGEDDSDDDSELAEAMDEDEVEEEDHGHGGSEPLVPEVLSAGARRPAADGGEP